MFIIKLYKLTGSEVCSLITILLKNIIPGSYKMEDGVKNKFVS